MTLVMHRSVSTTHFELPAAVLLHSLLEQMLVVCAAFSVFLVLQLGQGGFYHVFLDHPQAFTGCCSAHQAISHLMAPNTCTSQAVLRYPQLIFQSLAGCMMGIISMNLIMILLL